MINKQYGIYLVLEKNTLLTKEKKKTYWKCQCQKCGSIKDVRSDNLKREPSSCPNCKNDITNKRFGRLIVISKGKIDKNGHAYWWCKCDCGNQKEISGSNLISGKVLSCGCLHKEKTSQLNTTNLTGQKYGKLTVLQRSSPVGEKIRWLCKCDCGCVIEVNGSNLKSGHTTSCGCIHSKGELKISQLLNNLQVKFKKEYIFKNLPNRRFDFYLPDYNICIEYDGKQHFNYINTWHKTEEDFQQAQLRDKEKSDYCKKNQIFLIRIPYTDYNLLDENYLKQLINGAKNVDTE